MLLLFRLITGNNSAPSHVKINKSLFAAAHQFMSTLQTFHFSCDTHSALLVKIHLKFSSPSQIIPKGDNLRHC